MALRRQKSQSQAKPTPYTPNFYGLSLDSSTDSGVLKTKPHPPSAYLDRLSRTHVALSQLVTEVPASDDDEDDDDDDNNEAKERQREREQRIAKMREHVLQAYDAAKGDPADGRWSALSRLLSMGCTAGGGRWVDTRADNHLNKMPPPACEWILAESEEEWAAWERARERDVRLKLRVESWKKTLVVEEEATRVKPRAKPQPAQLGFPVLNRPANAANVKPKAKPVKPNDTNKPKDDPHSKTPKKISDVPESVRLSRLLYVN